MIYPLFLMMLLTFIVGCIAVKVRFASVKNGQMRARDFKLMQGGDATPELVIKTTRNFNNLFEIPVLFYVVGCLFISLNIQTDLSIITAWLFVISRYVHSFIHISYNHVLHRLLVFWFGAICILVLWCDVLIQQM